MTIRIRRSTGAPVVLDTAANAAKPEAGAPRAADVKPAPARAAKAKSKASDKAATKPATKDSAKPTASEPTKSATKRSAKSAAKQSAKPAAKSAAKPTAKSASRPAPKSESKSKSKSKPKSKPKREAKPERGPSVRSVAKASERTARAKPAAPGPRSKRGSGKTRRSAQNDLFSPMPSSETAVAIAEPKGSRKRSKRDQAEPTDESPTPEAPLAPDDKVVAAKAAGPRRRATAESMAQKQREISVSEFFMKNRHLLGFDSPARALLTTVKEAIDNSLDACEEAGILPSVRIELVELAEDRFRVIAEDNGPGILKAQVPKVFGKLLYGSKFHRLRQARGQQGIGISAAGMYGQLTTGKPIVITSKTGKGRPAHHFEIVIDASRNTPNVVKDETIEWDRDHGTRVEIELQGTYKGGRRSVDEYIEQVGIANPHAEIHYQPPKGRSPIDVARVTTELPREPLEIKPHPYGVELGILQRILQDTEARSLSSALQSEFSRVTPKVAEEILQKAVLSARARPGELKPGEIERLHNAIPQVKIFAPPSACVVPIGEELIRKGLEREIEADFYVSATRPPAVYRGNPFQVEVGLAYGGSLRGGSDDEEDVEKTAKETDAQEGPITLLRLANRVPLQYQQSSCAAFKAVVDANWRSYGLSQPRGSLPQGPMVLLVHMASVWVPFTSESKEAIAHYAEILKEMTLALQECGRRLGTFLRRREAERNEMRRRSIFEMYIGELVESLGKLTPVDRQRLQKDLMVLARQHTGDGDEDAELAVGPTRKVTKRDDELDGAERRAAGGGRRSKAGSAEGAKPKRGRRKAGRAATPQLDLLPDEEEES